LYSYDSNNLNLKIKLLKLKKKLENGLPTVPTILDDEIQCNIFLKAKDVKTFQN
jgi:hydroxyacylglutathione hydrolase